MRRFARAFVLLAIWTLLISVAAQAQANSPDIASGLGAYQSFHGGDIDNVNLQNGNLVVRIPLISYPQRGSKLKLTYSLVWNGKPYSYAQVCPTINGGYGQCIPAWEPGGTWGEQWVQSPGWILVQDQDITPSGYNYSYAEQGQCNQTQCPMIYEYIAEWMTSDGAIHMADETANGTGQQALDGSGYFTGYLPNPPTGVASCAAQCYTIDADGIIYYPNGKSGSILREDPDGNEITSDSSGNVIDTVGRIIPPASTSTQDVTTAESLCSSSSLPALPLAIASATLWKVPGANGSTLDYAFCYATVSLNMPPPSSAPGGSAGLTTTTTYLERVVLPNDLAWTFAYNSVDQPSCSYQGNPCNFGDLSQVTFPTGGTLTYTYTLSGANSGNLCGPPMNTICHISAYVATRTENSNDGTGPHQWTYSIPNLTQATVTDPLGNQTVHTYSSLNGMQSYSTPYYETLVQYYTGTATGTPLKSVATTYYWFAGPAWAGGAQNALPQNVTTTLDNGKSTQTSYQYFSPTTLYGTNTPVYFSGVSDEKVYNFAASGTGTLLREKQTTYQAQVSSSYLTANMLHLHSSDTVYNGSNTEVASTTYAYDGGSLQTSNISTQHTTPLAAVRGHVTSTTQWLSGGTSPVSTAVWYDTGELYQSVEPPVSGYPNKTTTYQYNSAYVGALLTEATNPASQSISYTYDPGLGLKTSATDPNNDTTTYTYDNYGRLNSVTYPDNGSTTYHYNDSSTAPWFSASVASSKNTADVVQVNLDGYGREVESQAQSDPGGTVYVDTTRDALGRKATVSNPYRTKSDLTYGLTTYGYDAISRAKTVTHPDSTVLTNNYTGASIEVVDETGTVKTSTQKDALGRVTFVCEEWPSSPVQALQGSYGDTTATTCSDLDNAPSGFETKYTYDVLGNLQTVSQGSLPVRTFTYDTLSRLTGAYNPEYGSTYLTGSDPCGTVPTGVNTAYCYDADGNVTSRTRWAPNQTGTPTVMVMANYTPDILNRITQTTYTDSYNSYQTPTQHFIYDSPDTGVHLPAQTNLVGRLATAYTMDSSGNLMAARAYSYDPVGRTNALSECTIDDCAAMWYYELLYTYDINGDLLTDTLNSASGEADTFTLTYVHNPVGQLISLTSSLVATNFPATLFTANGSSAYSPLGGLMSGTLGNGATETFAYDVRNRLGCETVKSGSVTLYAVTLANANGQCSGTSGTGYAGNGNVLQAQDSVNGNWTYAYDNMSHLISAQQAAGAGPVGSGGGTATWTYDRFGNRWSQTVTSQTAQEFTFTKGTNRPDQSAASYDAVGNLMNDGVHSYVYDDENRIIEASLVGGGTEYYDYDAEGQRIRKSSGSFETQGETSTNTEEYVYNKDGQLVGGLQPNGSFNRAEVYAGSRHLATYDGKTSMTYFIHDDWQGTERARSNASGVSYETCVNLPYGDQQTCTGASDPSPLHYTGKMRDSETQLDYYGARYYSSTAGHWMSPDWASKPTAVPYANFGDPQSLNLYGMVTGNPVSKQDSDGHKLMDYLTGWSSAGGTAGGGGGNIDPPITTSTTMFLAGFAFTTSTTTYQDGSSKTTTQIGLAQQQVSQAGQDFIKGYEKLSLTVYDASKGKVKGGDWTIGYGHKTTKDAGPITLPEAEALFQGDVARMASHVSADLNVPVSQNQFDALVSLRFNAGANAITPPVSALNSTGHATMGDFTNHYITAGGVPMRGLELRRAAEWRIFSEGVYDASH
jgi:RHS repeat-associated protein